MTTYTKVEEIEVLVYVAEDGTEFYDEQECLAYESRQHVSAGVKNVYVYFDEGINGKGIYAIHSLKDFTSLSYVLELSRTNQEINGSDISFKSVTATFDRYPFVIIHNPVTQTFKIQTVEKFKERYEIEKIIQKMKDLENIMIPITDTPTTPENPDTPPSTDGDNKGDGSEGTEQPTTPTEPVTPPGDGEDNKDPENPDTGNEGDNKEPGPENPVTPPITEGGDNSGEENPDGSETPKDPDDGSEGGKDPGNQPSEPVVPPTEGGDENGSGEGDGSSETEPTLPDAETTPPTTEDGGETGSGSSGEDPGGEITPEMSGNTSKPANPDENSSEGIETPEDKTETL